MPEERIRRLEQLVEGMQKSLEENRNRTSHSIDQLRGDLEAEQAEHTNTLEKMNQVQLRTNVVLQQINTRMVRLLLVLNVFLFVAVLSGAAFITFIFLSMVP